MSYFRPRQYGLFIVILSSTLSLKTVVFLYLLFVLRSLSPPSYSLIQIDITVTCEWRWLLYVKLPSSPMRLVHRHTFINALPKNSPPDCFLNGRLQVPSQRLTVKIKSSQHKCVNCFLWCEWRDLNPYVVKHTPLKRACLPIPAHSHLLDFCRFLNSTIKIIS